MQSENTVTTDKNDENSIEVKKKQDKERKKSEKKMEQFMKSIANLSAEEKIDVLCKKNNDTYEEIRTFKASIQLLQRRIGVLEKEKEQLQNEQSKSVLARSRLETLCRELQRQNKSIKDESLQKIREEEEKRKEVSNRFQAALNEVTQMMQQNTDKNLKLRDDNLEISNKFQKLCEQFKQREEEVAQLTKQMDLEKQLAEATVKRAECQLIAEREIWAKEREQILKQLKASEEEKIKLEVSLKSMEEHLSVYSSRYEEFESTINKSNQVFDSYKSEMSRMTKQVNKLEKDCTTWKDRWMQTHRHLNQIMNHNQLQEIAIKDREKKLDRVSNLCRLIQEERGVYLRQLKDEGIVPKTVSEPAPTTIVNNNKGNKMTKKEKELHELKKNVQALELQLNEAQQSSEKVIESSSTTQEHTTEVVDAQEQTTEVTDAQEQTTEVTYAQEETIDVTDAQEQAQAGNSEAGNHLVCNSEVDADKPVDDEPNIDADFIASTLEGFEIDRDSYEDPREYDYATASPADEKYVLEALEYSKRVLHGEETNGNEMTFVKITEAEACFMQTTDTEDNCGVSELNTNPVSEDVEKHITGTDDNLNMNDNGKKNKTKRKNGRSKKNKK